METPKNIDKYLDAMEQAHESSEVLSFVDLALRYATMIQAVYRLEDEIRGVLDYDSFGPEPVITAGVADNAGKLAMEVIRYHLGKVEYDTAIANGLQQDT